MSATDVPPLRLTATVIAQYFRFRCDRQLRYELVPERFRGGEIPARNTDPARGPLVGPRPGAGLLKQAGQQWERRRLRRLVERLDAGTVLCAGWTESGDPQRLPYPRMVEALRSAGDLRAIVQPELRPPDPVRFAARFGLEGVPIQWSAVRPDLLRVRRQRDGTARLTVLDIKASAEASVAHCAQIAYYSLLLEEILLEEGIDAARLETRFGWVWARDGRGPQRFALGAYRHHVAEFLREHLPRVAARAPGACAWHLSSGCAGCSFLQHCRAEADERNDLSRVVGVTPLGKEVLRSRGIDTVSQLARGARRDTFRGCHALEANAARLEKRAHALEWGKLFDLDSHTHLLGPHEDVRVVVTVEGDPVTGRCFALGLRIAGPGAQRLGGSDERVWIAGRGTHRAETELLAGGLAELDSLFTRVDALNRDAGRGALREPAARGRSREAGERRLTLHLYLWDRIELELLRALLARHLADLGVRPAIARLLRVVSARGALPDPEVLRNPLGSVVADGVAVLYALPIPYAYDLAAVSERLAPAEAAWVHHPRTDYGWPLSSQVAFERIHNVWRGRPHRTSRGVEPPEQVREEIRRTVESKLRAIDSVVRAVRERSAAHAARRGTERLLLRKEPFTLGPDEAVLADPALESLRVFATLESVSEAMAVRQLHLLPTAERARRGECIRDLHLLERREDGQLVFAFDPDCRNAKFRAGDFNLLLTNDDGRTLIELARHPWNRHKLQVELVELDRGCEPPRLMLAAGRGFERAEAEGRVDLDLVCVLDRAASDVNTRRVLTTLRALAERREGREEQEENALVGALLHGTLPERWAPAFGGSRAAEVVYQELLAPLGARRGQPVLNADQEHAWREVFSRPLALVWGPPGTGKTYLLAWMLVGLAAAAERLGRPCRILVTAATHRAVVNLLARTARELEAAGEPVPLRLVKLRGSGNDADRDLEGLAVEVVDDARLRPLLDGTGEGAGGAVVVGSTVWSLWKQMRDGTTPSGVEPGGSGAGERPREEPRSQETVDRAPVQPWFDLVVIDEASQMKVPEALIAASSLRAGGQLILCGDHRQLAPVIHGRYGEESGTLFGSVFSHAAAHSPLLPLRESRRMNRALVEYPRELFYPGLVSMCPERRISLAPAGPDAAEPGAEPGDALLRELFLGADDAVVFCSYAGLRAAGSNPFEARLVARLVRLARAALLDPETGRRFTPERFVSQALAVISPHRAQNSAILAALREAGVPEAALPIVDTVERMQGNERDLIVVSYGVADREYAEAEAEFLLDANRFNVAITRPRAKLVVLMSEEVLAALPRDEEVLAGSLAIKGYREHCRDAVREAELPGPNGAPVRLRCHYRILRDE